MQIIDWKQMKEMCLNPYSRQHTKRLEDDNKFPKRIRIGNNRVGWSLAEVEEHNQKLADQRELIDTSP